MRLLCVFLSITWFVLPALAGDKPVQKIELTDMQALSVAHAMVNANDLDNATNLLNDILQSDDVNARTGALFEMGRAAIARNDYDTAIKYFLTILKWYPGYTNARIELARAYIFVNDYENADFQLRLALGDKNMPAQVVQQVQAMLNYVRQNKTWNVNAGLSLVPDTNINYANGQTQECVDFGFGPMCRQVPKQESSVGLQYDIGADYFWRISDRFSIRNSISLSALDFKNSQYDEYSLY
ncbi:MAG: tetratricopeptide repeat protein, partial [Alphaproteobacteria bacterium]